MECNILHAQVKRGPMHIDGNLPLNSQVLPDRAWLLLASQNLWSTPRLVTATLKFLFPCIVVRSLVTEACRVWYFSIPTALSRSYQAAFLFRSRRWWTCCPQVLGIHIAAHVQSVGTAHGGSLVPAPHNSMLCCPVLHTSNTPLQITDCSSCMPWCGECPLCRRHARLPREYR